MDAEVEQLLDLERRRCAAISSGDVEGLGQLLSDDYLHIHMTGATDDRAGHLEAVAARPRTPVRGDVRVRIYGDLAILTGDLANHMNSSDAPGRVVHAHCHQVAVRRDGRWRFVAIQLTAQAAKNDRTPRGDRS
jgi:ketosteroid isomerase-like protein